MLGRCFLFALAACSFAGCSTTAVPVRYEAPASVAKAAARGASVTVGAFQDGRQEPDKKWIGAIRGGFGNPLKVLHSDVEVADMVRTSFVDGLAARGVQAGSGTAANTLTGRIVRLDCDQYVRREATVQIELSVQDTTGRTKFTRAYAATKVDGSMMTLSAGVFGSVEELRAVLERTLRETVDKALDDSAMRAALQI